MDHACYGTIKIYHEVHTQDAVDRLACKAELPCTNETAYDIIYTDGLLKQLLSCFAIDMPILCVWAAPRNPNNKKNNQNEQFDNKGE
eukprot:4202408-Amphidinium_carterae.1